MVVITVEKCKKANHDVVRIKNSDLFWINMFDVQQGLGVKNISDLVRKEIMGIFNNKKPTLNQIKECKLPLADLVNNYSRYSNKIKYIRSDLIEIRNNTNRENFRILLGFNKNDIFVTKEASVLKL